MTGLDYMYEMQEWEIKGKHLAKVYHNKGLYFLKLGSQEILVEPGKRAHISVARVLDTTPSGEAMLLRKHFEGSRLKDVYLLNMDRILVWDFGDKRLVFEMFGSGNRLIVDENWNIIHAQHHRVSPYKPKPPLKLDELELSEEPIGKTLSRLPYGTPYVKVFMESLGIDPRAPGTQYDRDWIVDEWKKRLENLAPYYTDDDYFLWPRPGYERWEGPFWRLLDRLYWPRPRLKKVEKREIAGDLRRKAEWIWNHADWVDEIIENVKKGQKPDAVVEVNWKQRWFVIEVDGDD